MSGQSAFEKRYVDPKDQSNVEGLLEHFNLPPKAIAFLRENKRAVQVAIAAVIVTVVGFSLYQSYAERQVEQSASALAVALKKESADKLSALQGVENDFSGTAAATWARVEIAHLAMAEKDFPKAAELYQAINSGVKETSPLYGLSLMGAAQAEEAGGILDSAYQYFDKLKAVEGYQLVGYNGLARIHESRGEIDKALGIYGQYLAMLNSEGVESLNKSIVEDRIARLKAHQ